MEAETNTSGDDLGKENAAGSSSGVVEDKTEEGNVDLGRVLKEEPVVDSVVKPLVEELTQAAESLVQNVSDQPSSYVTQVEEEVDNLVSDPWASLRNLEPVQESSIKNTDEMSATSDEKVVESLEPVKSISAEHVKADSVENSRNTHTQPFVAVTAATRASWTNCCGLLDVLGPSDQ